MEIHTQRSSFFFSFALRCMPAMVTCFVIALVAFVVVVFVNIAIVVALKHIMKTESNDVKKANQQCKTISTFSFEVMFNI